MKIKQLIIGLVICVLCITMTQLPTVLAAEKSSSEDEYAFRWFYTFGAILEDGKPPSFGTLNVIEVVELWRGGRQIASSRTTLDCQKYGNIGFDGAIVFIGEGHIECETIDLREEILDLSLGEADICGGSTSCPIFVEEVINKIDIVPLRGSLVSPTHSSSMLDGPIFVAPQVILSGGGTVGNQHVMTLELRHSPQILDNSLIEASIDRSLVSEQFKLEISQQGLWHNFYVNDRFVDRDHAQQILTRFTSEPETIYFGYNPATGEYLTGSFYNGEFDPVTGCSSCNDPH